MAWQSLSISTPELNIQPLLDLIDLLKELLSKLVDAIEIILAALQAFVDPLVALLTAIINKIKETIEGFLEDLGGYGIYIPIRKRLQTEFLGLGDLVPNINNPINVLFSQQTYPTANVSAGNPDERAQFIADANRYSGGNVGFFRTVVESLYDEGDLSRPQFWSPDDYVGGFILVVGTSLDPLGLLDDIWTLLGFFKNLTRGSGSIKYPRPEGLKAQVIEGYHQPEVSEYGMFSTLLTWKGLDVPVYTLPDLAGVILIPDRYAIIRTKNNPNALLAQDVVDLMGSRQLKTGDKFNNNETVVIYEGNYDLTQNSYLDTDILTKEDDSFYYAVAWKLNAVYQGTVYDSVKDKNIVPQELTYNTISNVVRVVPYTAVPDSTPPDWHRTPALEDIMPDFASVLRKIVAILEGLLARMTGVLEMWKEYINFLKNEILRYEGIIAAILDEIKRMLERFNFNLKCGIYIRGFVGKGGNYFFMNDLIQSLSPSYPDSPPFHRGDEFVTGIILMQGGPQVMVESFVKGLSWLFGNVDALKNTEEQFMLSDLGQKVTKLEEELFDAEMKNPPEESDEPKEPVSNAINTVIPVSQAVSTPDKVVFKPSMEVDDAPA